MTAVDVCVYASKIFTWLLNFSNNDDRIFSFFLASPSHLWLHNCQVMQKNTTSTHQKIILNSVQHCKTKKCIFIGRSGFGCQRGNILSFLFLNFLVFWVLPTELAFGCNEAVQKKGHRCWCISLSRDVMPLASQLKVCVWQIDKLASVNVYKKRCW